MNENIDLTKILKDCPTGTKFYSTVLGEIKLIGIINGSVYPIIVSCNDGNTEDFTADGKLIMEYDGDCVLFPSKDQRDWSKFTAPWYKKEKFNPNTLKPFDRVLVRDWDSENLSCGFFSHISVFEDVYRYKVGKVLYKKCIPYNDDTKHLVGTTEEAPEYYRYWEDKNMENKIYTDILQSKKLAEIIPLESSDMYYSNHSLENYYSPIPNIGKYSAMHNQIPCWSISALLEIIRNNGRYELQMFEGGYYFEANGFMTESYFNPVDTCYEFILKLHELNML